MNGYITDICTRLKAHRFPLWLTVQMMEKNTLKVWKNNKASLCDLVSMLLTSIRRGGGRGGEVEGEINNWTERTA